MNPGSSRRSSPATRRCGGRRNSGIEQSLAETALQALDEREPGGPELRRGYEPPVAFVGLERLLGRQELAAAAGPQQAAQHRVVVDPQQLAAAALLEPGLEVRQARRRAQPPRPRPGQAQLDELQALPAVALALRALGEPQLLGARQGAGARPSATLHGASVAGLC